MGLIEKDVRRQQAYSQEDLVPPSFWAYSQSIAGTTRRTVPSKPAVRKFLLF